jgi:hypothetical protein
MGCLLGFQVAPVSSKIVIVQCGAVLLGCAARAKKCPGDVKHLYHGGF